MNCARVASNKTMVSGESVVGEDASMQAEKPAWILSFKMVPCVLNPDLSQLGPFSKGLNKKWGAKSDHKLVETGMNLAKDFNCRLCDIEVRGSILPESNQGADTGASWRETDMTCGVKHGNEQEACFTENGNIGNWDSGHLSPLGKCAPCPAECDKGCEGPGKTDSWSYSSKDWFKCKLTDTTKLMDTKKFKLEAGAKSHFRQQGKLFTTPSKYECEQIAVAKLQKSAKEVWRDGDGPVEGTGMAPAFGKRSGFETSGEFKLWCKYKPDHLPAAQTAKDGNFQISQPWESERISPRIAPGSEFRFEGGFSQCDSGMPVGAENDFSPFVAALVSHVPPILAETAKQKNCDICEFNLGGDMETLLSDKPQEAWSNVVLIKHSGANAVVQGEHHSSWIQPICATDKLGVGACKHTEGPVGWAVPKMHSDATCLPCPPECASCEVSPKKDDGVMRFHCALRPLLPFPNPTMASLIDDFGTSEGEGSPVEDSQVYELPQGYKCETPNARKCSGSDWCADWQFETQCEFNTFN